MGELLDKVEDYVYGDVYPLHSPGHKRSYYDNDFLSELYKRDITGVEGFDRIAISDGSVSDAMNRAAKAYKADETFFLLNGASAGIMAAVFATVKRGGKVLLMRNSRKYVYNALSIREIGIIYLSGEIDEELGLTKGLTVENVEDAIKKNEDIQAVIITSPTMDGISSEVEDIAELLHEKRIPLIVDASYGSHFGFAGFLPINAVECGADVVIHSLYETLPSPVQTGLIHVNGSIVDKEKIRGYLDMFQSEELSYPLMTGIDECIKFLNSNSSAWQSFYDKRAKLSDQLRELKHIEVFDAFTMGRSDAPEIGKMLLIPKTKNMNGKQLFDRLKKEFGIQPSMAMPEYVLLSFSVCDTEEGYERLYNALKKLDAELEEKENTTRTMSGGRDLGSLEALFGVSSNNNSGKASAFPSADTLSIVRRISDATMCEMESVPVNMCEGRISGVYVGVYPSEQPMLVPGQRITKEILGLINHYKRCGFAIQGEFMERIEVLRESKHTLEA